MVVDSPLQPAQALALIPQRPPFRFIDELLELSPRHAVGRYTFREDESFYAGHFPGRPLTPAVVLLEAMGQTAQAIWLRLQADRHGRQQIERWVALFTDGQIEALRPVWPGTRVTSRAELEYFRMGKLRAAVTMMDDEGRVVAHGVSSGVAWER